METSKLKVLKENALIAYNAADANGKKMLENLFPGELKPVKITDRIKTFEDALSASNLSLSYFESLTLEDSADEIAYRKLKIIIRALNEGWVPDWTNGNESKWWPYFVYKSGLGFSDSLYVSWSTCTVVGSRLVFKSRELAEYAAKQFESIYNDYLTIQ